MHPQQRKSLITVHRPSGALSKTFTGQVAVQSPSPLQLLTETSKASIGHSISAALDERPARKDGRTVSVEERMAVSGVKPFLSMEVDSRF